MQGLGQAGIAGLGSVFRERTDGSVAEFVVLRASRGRVYRPVELSFGILKCRLNFDMGKEVVNDCS